MGPRTQAELHDILSEIPGVKKAYYSPPSGINMDYPCIIHKLSSVFSRYADNFPYIWMKCYTLTLIDEDPDTEIFYEILKMPYCSLDRPPYVADGLNHYIFTLFF